MRNSYTFAGPDTKGVITTGEFGTLITRVAHHTFYGGGAGAAIAQTHLDIPNLKDPEYFLLKDEKFT